MNRMPIEAKDTHHGILWDLDGVLVDTGEYHYQSWRDVLQDYGFSLDQAAFQKTFGMNNAGTLEFLFGRTLEDNSREVISRRKEEIFRQLIQDHISPLPGVLNWLNWFYQHHLPMAVASSAPAENIDFLINALQIKNYFEYQVSGADLPGKPEPAVFLAAAAKLGIPPGKCIVIEDSISGVEAARRAGMRCIAVTTTYPAQALATADLVVNDLTFLTPAAFQRLLNQ